ncbi:hypothetical protein, partial [Cupriavidus taiwanensis]|uniref:hypothetical protein n=1 Tax=Cupriavidus taiwanensis TaxID=164546 RepID=UPI001E32CC3C
MSSRARARSPLANQAHPSALHRWCAPANRQGRLADTVRQADSPHKETFMNLFILRLLARRVG